MNTAHISQDSEIADRCILPIVRLLRIQGHGEAAVLEQLLEGFAAATPDERETLAAVASWVKDRPAKLGGAQ